jgi:hypothetical protein
VFFVSWPILTTLAEVLIWSGLVSAANPPASGTGDRGFGGHFDFLVVLSWVVGFILSALVAAFTAARFMRLRHAPLAAIAIVFVQLGVARYLALSPPDQSTSHCLAFGLPFVLAMIACRLWWPHSR